MKAKLVQIGNSRGIRLPKPIIKEVGLDQEVEIRVREGKIVISPFGKARSGWNEAAKRLHIQSGDTLLDSETITDFDEREWKW